MIQGRPPKDIIGLTFTLAAMHAFRNTPEFYEVAKYLPADHVDSFDAFTLITGLKYAIIPTQTEGILSWTDENAMDKYVEAYEDERAECSRRSE